MVHTKRPEDKHACSKCNSSHVDIYSLDGKKYISCLDCGFEEGVIAYPRVITKTY